MKHFFWAILFIILSTIDTSGQEIMTWRECVAIAEKNNPQLASAKEKIKQAKADVGISRSPMLPHISTDASASRSKSHTRDAANANSYSYGINGRQLIFDGMKSNYDTKGTKKMASAADYNYRVISSNLRMNLRNAYVRLMKAQDARKIAEKITDRRKQNYELVKLRYKAGNEHRGSLLTAKADLTEADFELKQAKRETALATNLLKKEMGLKIDTIIMVENDFTVHEATNTEPEFSNITENNPLLQEIIHTREAARYNAKSARANFFPKVYGYLAAGRSSSQWPPGENELSMGLEMSFPLFEGGKRFYKASKADAEYRQINLDVKSIRENVIYTLNQKWTELLNKKDNVSVRLDFLNAAKERSKIAEAQYSIGIISFDNWTIIEDSMVRALKNYLNARAEALYAEAQWIQAKGETLDYNKK